MFTRQRVILGWPVPVRKWHDASALEIAMWTNHYVPQMVIISCFLGSATAGEADWPSWRGPEANGHSREAGLPHRWDDDAITWKTQIDGRGQSSPTIWGERIFLTSAIDRGRQRAVICIDRADGRILWQQIAWTGKSETTHQMNGWASSTCATDGRHVYAFFGYAGGLHCYDISGKHAWSRELGDLKSRWGTAASPLLVGDLVIQNCDADQDACIMALDKETGREIWRTDRPDFRGWSSPVLVHSNQRDEVILNGHTGVTAYSPESGRLLWFCACPRGRGSPSVTPTDGLLFVANGLSGGGMYCVKPGGSGDVTETQRLWFAPRRGRDLSSPIVVNDTVLLMGLRSAVLTAYDKGSGEELWQHRVGGQVSASPISYDGLAFFIRESGETVVVDPKSEARIVATNTITAADDENFRASITPSDGQLFIRSDQQLYCVGTRKTKQGDKARP